MNLNNHKFYSKWFKNPWSYVTGAVALSLFQIVTLAITREPWGISSTLTDWGAQIFEFLGGDVSHWKYFNSHISQEVFPSPLLRKGNTIRNLGIIIGALFSTLMASEFKFRKIKSKKQFFAAAIGGILMGYGSRLALGCNIGAFYSGISSLSLSGWIFAIFLFIGAMIGSKIILKFFL
ncbi:hypothetical protein SAMN02745973_00787 [Garciella nitratireducens DSM 15102]|uniref:Uncharacterized protein n=1 Tax=Garciella nitratireducens DSM 15102 TaxID=1121911 RepID=A0A1T4L249_9FIRM|nr:hypothetical protein DFR81_11246 [Garciella nitratireducens]SJZ48671.1 hypothetical protein SAMN02745973_00787 [Garciella nitratireducens DSM 15102]